MAQNNFKILDAILSVGIAHCYENYCPGLNAPHSILPPFFHYIFLRLNFSVIADSKLITIVRSIPSLYESNFGYFYHRTKEFEQAKTLENFYTEPTKYFNLAKYDSRSMFARNAMAYDLGYQNASKNLKIRKVFKVFIKRSHQSVPEKLIQKFSQNFSFPVRQTDRNSSLSFL